MNEYYEPAKGDAVAALGLLGDERAVPVLAEHLANEKDPNLRFQITKALGWIKSPKAVPALEKALKDEDGHVRNGAAMALKGITGKEYQVGQRPGQAVPGLDELAKGLARLQGADRRPGPGKPFLEVGKWYRFARVPLYSGTVKVLEVRADKWVKVIDQRRSTFWVNLALVPLIEPLLDQKFFEKK